MTQGSGIESSSVKYRQMSFVSRGSVTSHPLVGWLTIALVVAVWDWLASRQGGDSLSKLVRNTCRQDLPGSVTIGIAAGLAWHLFAYKEAPECECSCLTPSPRH